MKKIKYILLTIILGMSINSCSFLDVEPQEMTLPEYFKTESELNAFLLGVYAPLTHEQFYGNNFPLYVAGGDDLSFFQRSDAYTSMLCANANSGTTDIMTFWRILYEGINRANVLLESADRNEEIPVASREKVKAEALFLRAFYHFHLVQGWGDVPLKLTSTQKIEGLSIPRDSKDKVYDRIISDIIDVLPLLPETKPQTGVSVPNGKITRTAAQGILARIYLFRAGEHKRDNLPAGPEVAEYYKQAKEWALKVKNSGVHGLVVPYSRIFIDLAQDKYNSTGVVESLWEAEMAGNRSGPEQAAGRMGNTVGFGSTVDFSTNDTYKNLTGMQNPGYSYRFIFASLKLYQMYEEEMDTVRGNWNIAPYEYKITPAPDRKVEGRTYFFGKRPAGLTSIEGMPCDELTLAASKNKTRSAAKYRREYELVSPKHKNYTPTNFPILRYSDVLLMLAEAENELNGPTALAYECINAVRTRAALPALTGLSKDAFLTSLKKERAMELCFEASRRWDLIRWGDFMTSMQGMSNYIGQDGWNPNHAYAKKYYQVTTAYVYFPIPDWEMSTNKRMIQNKGW